ncbi:MAG: V-type ATPase subunit [Methanoregulaceae archaeon]|nr:V-type ATPase subunit [Methanoregulaceae archaeon]
MVVDVEYGYLNARIRGMKSRLLPESIIENLILKPDVEAIITELEKTSYKEEIEKASVQFSGVTCIETALRKDLTQAFRKIMHHIRGEDAEKYVRIILNRWDVQNIKTILRGKNIHATPSEIFECLVPAGDLDDSTHMELVKQPDVKAVIDLLATWGIEYARPLTRSFQEYNENHDLSTLEYALDKFYFENALELLKGESYNEQLVREMIETEIDVTNLKSVFKIILDRTETVEAERYFIRGGMALNMEKLLSMVRTGTLDGAIKHLGTTPYDFLAKLPDDAFMAEKISVFEKAIDNYLIRKGVSQFLGDPLSIAIMVGYFWAKYCETVNLRIIARLKTVEVTEKELRENLIYV